MKTSIRNQISGTVKSIKNGGVMSEVIIQTKGGDELAAVITVSSVKHLKLKKGSKVTALIKSTNISIGVE